MNLAATVFLKCVCWKWRERHWIKQQHIYLYFNSLSRFHCFLNFVDFGLFWPHYFVLCVLAPLFYVMCFGPIILCYVFWPHYFMLCVLAPLFYVMCFGPIIFLCYVFWPHYFMLCTCSFRLTSDVGAYVNSYIYYKYFLHYFHCIVRMVSYTRMADSTMTGTESYWP